jgi:hypothetical protein
MRLKWMLVLVRLEIVLILTQDGCTVCVERTICLEIVVGRIQWFFLGDVGQVESRFIPFIDSVSISAIWVHGLRQTYHRLRNSFGHTQWYS